MSSSVKLIIKSLHVFLVLMTLAASQEIFAAQSWDVRSDTWVATDAVGRKLPDYTKCNSPRAGKYVGIFYVLWHGTVAEGPVEGPYDITKILAANPDDPKWGPLYAFHHWAEPQLGYYLSADPYVIRKHCQMLADAGVDTLILDVTNGLPYTSVYMTILRVYQQIRNAGGKTPQICFFVNPLDNSVVKTIYNDLYSRNLYHDLWFKWRGKPLILTTPKGLDPAIQNFFTFRKTWGLTPPDEADEWSFMERYPQQWGWHTSGVPEEITVSVAQQESWMSGPNAHGRSYQKGVQPSSTKTDNTGRNFQEQWERALSVDPDFMFITEWNEWIAQRFVNKDGSTFFVDQYTQEFSRDIEPMKGGHSDNYYYQMVSNIRRYKGVRKPDTPTPPKTIKIDGKFTDWTDVGPKFRDDIGDTTNRRFPGWGKGNFYENKTGRNDFIIMKVAYDADWVYFYVQTKLDITSHTDKKWMLLFIDSDADGSTGWQGYDYLINDTVIDSHTTTLKKCEGGWKWTTVCQIPYRVAGRRMELAVPRQAIGKGTTVDVALDFHWADNIQKDNDINEFSISGDSAPDMRFNYRYAKIAH